MSNNEDQTAEARIEGAVRELTQGLQKLIYGSQFAVGAGGPVSVNLTLTDHAESGDGQLIITATPEGTMHLWGAESRVERGPGSGLPTKPGVPFRVKAADGGTSYACATPDGAYVVQGTVLRDHEVLERYEVLT
ncbi:hypothetical protein [Brevibacterium sp.]|uniref:hypothetical protein n=1 Tax=Brevibacterium sp. TaxID=1701 RepID=UPI002810BC6C|nr:hypothetical protein [Brevibacterium sp.]